MKPKYSVPEKRLRRYPTASTDPEPPEQSWMYAGCAWPVHGIRLETAFQAQNGGTRQNLPYHHPYRSILRRLHKTKPAVRILAHQNHAVRLYSFEIPRCQIGQQANLAPHDFFRFIILGNAAHHGTGIDAGIQSQLQELLEHSLELLR